MADSAEPRDLQASDGASRRYSAFISYSHADNTFAKRLQRKLETYRLPHRLAATAGRSRRLKPVFRDSTELTVSYDLTAAVRDAIAQSDFMIVVCSHHSARSLWVGREIELFRRLRGDRQILTAMAEGDVSQGDDGAVFHPALRGRRRHHSLHPLAADFRPGHEGKHFALLKLVAVLAGVGLDELIQRDAQRRLRNLLLVSGGTVASLAIVAGLSVAALTARADADAQRRRAGGLGEFMATDLRKGLEAAGRHDLLDQVNRAALNAYGTEDLSRLTPDQLEQRAKLLQGAGKDAEKRGDLRTAHSQFEAARRSTAALLAAKPNEPKRIFAHAQSEYWIGFINWREGNSAAAKAGYEAYAQLANRLVATDPNNDDWRKERVYAAGMLGALAMRQAGDPATAERYFRAALAELDTILGHRPDDTDVMMDRANGLAWLADAQRLQGHLPEATATRAEQRDILQRLLAANPRNLVVKAHLLFNELAVARIALAEGDTTRALTLLEAGRQHALDLQAQDPDNKDFPKQGRMFELFQARVWLSLPPAKRPPPKQIAAVLGDCHLRAPGSDNVEISDFCNVLLARLRSRQGDEAGADAALAPVRQHVAARHDILTARWGLDLAAEARPVQLAEIKGETR